MVELAVGAHILSLRKETECGFLSENKQGDA